MLYYGAATSMLIAVFVSSLVSQISVDSRYLRSIIFLRASILAGFIIGAVTTMVIGRELLHFLSAILSLAVTMIVIFAS